ncbi:MAG: PKD domain-containing protein, partial [Mucilaginibacter sp.]
VQYAVSQGESENCAPLDRSDVGDPEMIYLNPLEQTIDDVTLYSTNNYQIFKNYINVVIPTDAVATFTIDGAPPNANFIFAQVPGNPLYSYIQIPVSVGTHHIKASKGFNAIAYGFGNLESYGYAAGTSLKDLNEYIALNNPLTNSSQSDGCSAVTYKIQVTLPFQTTNIKWDFKDGTTPYVDNNPVVKTIIKKGNQTLYVYEYPKLVTYKSGSYTVVTTVFNPIGDDCGSSEDIELDYNISDDPKANFSFSGQCPGAATAFKDMSDAGDNSIKTWLWDFGDGHTAIVQNPAHTYLAAGDYTITLSVTNQNGCSSSSQQKMHINKKPIAAFKYSLPDCIGQNILFTDQSISLDEKIAQWIWDYGDGSPAETRTDNKSFTHVYVNTGPVTVKLTAVSVSGCVSDQVSQVISISPLPDVNFSLPDVCLADAYAQFNDLSTIADNSGAEFTYNWNFGDPNATSSYPNISTEKNPKHKYSQTGTYQVTLTVTSKSGCSFSKTQAFTVNGDSPKAEFSVENAN